MVDNNNDDIEYFRARRELLERYDKLCDKVDKDYRELLSLSLSLEDTYKKVKEHDAEYEKEWNDNMLAFYLQYLAKYKFNFTELRRGFNAHTHKLTLIINTLKDIQNSTCHQCKSQLPLNPYFFFYSRKSLIKWEINNIMEFNGWSVEPKIIFCSKDCYKQSFYYQDETKQNNTNNNQQQSIEKENNLSQQSKSTGNIQQQTKPEQVQYQEFLYCSAIDCHEEIPSHQNYYYNSKNPNHKFCSQNCYQDYYGEICYSCKNNFLKVYYWNKEKYPDLVYCSNCWDKEKQKESEQIQEKIKEQEEGIRKNSEIIDKLKKEQNINGTPTNLNNQINNLQKEINQLEKQSFVGDQNQTNPQQNLLNLKKEELENLEKRLNNQKTEQRSEGSFEKQKVLQKNNSKLILGIGVGILGLGLIGLTVWLFARKKRSR